MVGSKLVIGFPGTRVTDSVVRQFNRTRAGGVIFYRINFESPAQIVFLIRELEEKLQKKLLICLDHEGGRVVMYRDGVTLFPDNRTFGEAGKIEWARKAGEIAARELRALGTDVNFAPVLDVLTDAYSPNIGIRSYGSDWKKVAELGCAYIKALQAGGISATAKHFPGKGHAPVDAHLKLPTIPSTWDEMRAVHLQPFIKAIESGVDVIMSSHPRFPNLDPHPGIIATFSRRLMTDLLRDELGFKGVLSSDDLEMGAVQETCPIDAAAVKAAGAGHDLILSCHDFDSERKVAEGLLDAYKARSLSLTELEESVERIEKLKSKRPVRFEGPTGPLPEGPALAMEIARKGTVVFQDKKGLLPVSNPSRKKAAVYFPRLSWYAPKITIEREFEDEAGYLRKRLGSTFAFLEPIVYPIDPKNDDIPALAEQAKKADVVLFFSFDAHLFPGERQLLLSVQNNAPVVVAVLLRDPYDRDYFRPGDAVMTAFGFRRCQIEACLEKLTAAAT